MKKTSLILAVSFIFAVNTYAYDITGHRAVADIAYHNLTAATQQQLDNLLGVRGLIYYSTWADDMRNDSTYAYSYNWHFQNLPDSLSEQNLLKLWKNPLSQGEHLFYAVQTMIKRLKTNKKDVEALKFLVHFMADLHQPFHLGREEDRGGNDIKTKWFTENIRVHQLWDKDIVENQGYSYSEYSQYLKDKYTPLKNQFSKKSLFQSVQNVYAFRQELYKYDYTKMRQYTYNYLYKNKLDEMLYSAGIQLANVLNEIYE